MRKPLRDSEFSADNPSSAIRLAKKALMNSLVISISGVAFIVIITSAALDVNTPKEFGEKMKSYFGDRFRIQRGKNEAQDSFSELIGANSKRK